LPLSSYVVNPSNMSFVASFTFRIT
jgi:hypothetical protein